MEYKHIVEGRFVERPNRFIARVEIESTEESEQDGGSGWLEKVHVEKVHVKNTGRCLELLREGARVYLEKCGNPKRSTAYDLVAVEKGERMINIDRKSVV